MCSPKLLIHYGPEKPLVLECDASLYELGAVLAHTLPDGSEKPRAYSSRTLDEYFSDTSEKNYSQIEKESLAIILAIKIFHQYIFGRYATTVTDHKPPIRHIVKGERNFTISYFEIIKMGNYTFRLQLYLKIQNKDI